MENLSRRALFAGICGLAALSLVPMSAQAASVVKTLPNGKLSIRIKDIAKVVKVGKSVQVGVIKGQSIALSQTGPATFTAFSLTCPHAGVTVVKEKEGWICQAHGSQFQSNGALVIGPATTALTPVPAKVSRGILTIG